MEASPSDNESSPPLSDYQAMSLIWQMRSYDMLCIIARSANKDVADQLIELHAQGQILAPPPVYNPAE